MRNSGDFMKRGLIFTIPVGIKKGMYDHKTSILSPHGNLANKYKKELMEQFKEKILQPNKLTNH